MNHLVKKAWWDEYESLVYFIIHDDDGKKLWSSQWCDIRDLYEDKNYLDLLREEVAAGCIKFGVPVDTSSNSIFDWE